MATYSGTANNDFYSGTASADTIYGFGGNDVLIGNGGADYIDGGTGNDTVIDNDGQVPDTSADTLLGGDGDDTVYAGYLDNADGGTGTGDTLILRLDYAPGAFNIDFSYFWTGTTYVIDGATIQRFEKLQWVVATAYNDTIALGTPSGQTAEAAGGGGSDTLIGGAGNDILNADFFYSYAVVADTAYDVLSGGGGDDKLTGGLGDYLDGGSGIDQLTLDAGMSAVGVSLDFNTLIATGSDTLLGTAMYNFEDVAGVYGSLYDDVINVGSENFGTYLLGRDGNDTLIGGTGANTLNGGPGADTMSGGQGNDTYYVDNAGDITTEAAASGNDTVNSSITTTLQANIETLLLTGSSAINGTGNADSNNLQGNSGANTLDGGGGADTLQGNDGADILIGGAGQDVLTGGAGADQFLFAAGDISGTTQATADRISDFSHAAGDIINLAGIDAVAGGADEAFAFIGTAAFTGVAGQLRYAIAGGFTTLYGDTNGDGVADLAITLNGSVSLVAGDFVL